MTEALTSHGDDEWRSGASSTARAKGRARLLMTLADRQWTRPLPVYAWAIEHPEGVIVVDTGETARASEPGYYPRWHTYYHLGVRAHVRQSTTPTRHAG